MKKIMAALVFAAITPFTWAGPVDQEDFELLERAREMAGQTPADKAGEQKDEVPLDQLIGNISSGMGESASLLEKEKIPGKTVEVQKKIIADMEELMSRMQRNNSPDQNPDQNQDPNDQNNGNQPNQQQQNRNQQQSAGQSSGGGSSGAEKKGVQVGADGEAAFLDLQKRRRLEILRKQEQQFPDRYRELIKAIFESISTED